MGVAVNFYPPDLEREIKTFRKKIMAGADFAVSQPIFDVTPVRTFLQRYRDQFGEVPIPIMGGVLPPASLRNAEFLHNELPSIILPDWTLERMRQVERWPQGRDQDRARGAESNCASCAGRVRDADVRTV